MEQLEDEKRLKVKKALERFKILSANKENKLRALSKNLAKELSDRNRTWLGRLGNSNIIYNAQLQEKLNEANQKIDANELIKE